MHAVILYGGKQADAPVLSIHTLLEQSLRANGWSVETLWLEQMSIRPCIGCFNCWLRTPGECQFKDDGNAVARAMVHCEARFFLTPVTFGGYSGLLKTAMDRLVPTISPLFMRYKGEMHHKLRYESPSMTFAVGWQAVPDDETAGVFARLLARNALNMHAPACGSAVLHGGQTDAEKQAALATLLHALEARS